MNRRTRRKAYVVAVAGLVGATAPLWAPPLLARVPAFRVQEVGVAGTRYVPAAEVMALADVDSTASVWDDPSAWERRVASHRLVREARVRRAGLHRLEIRVEEVEPVALVATPRLVPVDARGRALPLDPAEHELDLPVLAGAPRLEEGVVTGDTTRALLEVLGELRAAEPSFVAQASELAPAPGGAVVVHMVGSGACDRILLPREAPARALRRVEMALGEHADRGPVEEADARFEDQVVLRPEAGA